MAETIKLAEFELDTSAIVEAAKKYKKEIDELKQKQKEIIASGEGITDQYIKNEAQLKTLGREYRLHIKTLDEQNQSTLDAQTLSERLEIALDSEVETIKDLREQNKMLNKIRNEVNINTKEGQEQINELNKKLDENNRRIKANVDSLAQQRMNVGNYTNSILDAYEALEKQKEALKSQEEAIKNARDKTEEGSKEWKAYSTALVKVENQMVAVDKEMGEVNDTTAQSADLSQLASGGIMGIATAAQDAGGPLALFKGILMQVSSGIMAATKAGLAFIATPIGAILAVVAIAVGAVISAFKRSEDSANKLKTAFAPLTAILDAIGALFAFIGDILIDVIVFGMDMATEAAKKLTEAFASLLGWMGFDAAEQGINALADGMERAAAAARQLQEDENKLVKAQREAGIIQLEYQTRAEKLRQLRDDESKSLEERIDANKRLNELLTEQANKELEIAQLSLSVIERRMEQEGRSTELLDQQAEAKLKIAEINERITSQQSEQLANENSLRKEAEAQAKAAAEQAESERQERISAHIEKMNQEIELFKAQQGFRKKTLEEELKISQQVADKKLAVLREQLKNELITRSEYNAQRLEIENEVALKAAEVTSKNALSELEEYRKTVEEKQKLNQFLSDQVLQERIELNNELLEQEKQYQELRLEQGLINQQEFDEAISELKEVNRIANEDLTKEREAITKAESDELEQLRFEEELERMLEQGATRFEIQREQQAQEFEQQQKDLDQAFRDQLISEELYNAKSIALTRKKERAEAQIKKEEREVALEATSSILESIGKLVDDNSAAGKAISIAKATISTYQGIAASVAQGWPAMIPGVIAATTTGFAAIRDIISTDIPSMSGKGSAGGGGGGGGAAPGMIPAPEYSAGFAASENPGMQTNPNTGTGVSDNPGINQQFDLAGMTTGITEAVREGAKAGTMEGSEAGITNLSTNKQIAKDSAF